MHIEIFMKAPIKAVRVANSRAFRTARCLRDFFSPFGGSMGTDDRGTRKTEQVSGSR